MKKYFILFLCLLPMLECHAGFHFSVAARGALGKASSEDTTALKSRDFYVYGAEATLGYRFGRLLVGGSADYNLWKQKTKPSEVDNTNMAGTQLNLSPVVGVGLGPFLILGKYIMSSTMSLDKKSSDGDKTSYTSPSMPSYSVQLNYRIPASRSYFGFEYTNVNYGKVKSGDNSATLGTDEKIIYSSYGLIYGFIF